MVSRGNKGTKDKPDTRSRGCGRCQNVKKHPRKDCPACEAEWRMCHKRKCGSGKSARDISWAQRTQRRKTVLFLGGGGMNSDEAQNEWIYVLQLNGKDFTQGPKSQQPHSMNTAKEKRKIVKKKKKKRAAGSKTAEIGHESWL